MLKQNDIVIYTAEAYSNAETVGKVGDTTVFVPLMIVGEQARVKINYAKKGVAYGDAVELLKSSSNRVKAQCGSFGSCGGCSLCHMSYGEQLNFKRNKVKNNLLKIAKSDAEVLPCVASPKRFHYRNKISLPVSGKRGDVIIGMYKRNSHQVVNIKQCSLVGEWAAVLINIFKIYCDENQIIPYDEKTFTGEVRHLTARYIDGQLLVTIVSNGEFKRDLHPLIEALKNNFEKFGLFINVNTYKNNVILGEITRHVYGLEYIESECSGVKTRVSPNSFFQVNDEVRDLIYSKTRELLDLAETEVLIDCFSGVGVLTNALACDKFETYAIEMEPAAVKNACETAELNGNKITNICGDVNIELPNLTQKLSNKKTTVVVDPPRKGLGEKICRTLLCSNVDEIVYVSCDSATLARDVAVLTARYNINYVQPFDMFPQTDNVETLVVLSHKKPDGHINVKVEFSEEEGQVSLKEVAKRSEERKPKEKATYKMIQDYIEKTYGFKVHTAYIAEVKRDLGLPMYDAPNAVEELKKPRAHPTPKMAEAIKETLKHFEII